MPHEAKGAVGLPSRVLLGLAAGALHFQGFAPDPWWPCAFLGAAAIVGLLDRSRTFAEAALPVLAAKAVLLVLQVPYLGGLGSLISGLVIVLYVLSWLPVVAGYWLARGAAGPLAAALALPGLFTLFEWAGMTLHFFPSQTAGLSAATGMPLLTLAPWLGVHGVSALSYAAAVLPWAAVRAAGARRRGAALGLAAAALAALALPPVAAKALLSPVAEAEAAPAAFRAVAFTLDAEKGVTWRVARGRPDAPARGRVFSGIRGALETFDQALGKTAPALVVLPEDAIDVTLAEPRSEEAFDRLGVDNNGPLIDGYRNFAQRRGAAVVAGLTVTKAGRRYNSSLLVEPDGRLAGLRDKWWLTIGSEHWPLPRWLPLWLLFAGDPQFVQPSEAYARPQDPFPPLTLAGVPLGFVVCGEAHIPSMYLGWRRAGARVLLLLANARWFRKDPSGYNAQLLRVARLCAAAYGLPVLLSGRAAYAGTIDARGNADVIRWPERGSAPLTKEALVTPASERTLAVRWGEYYLWLAPLVGLLSCAAAWKLGKPA